MQQVTLYGYLLGVLLFGVLLVVAALNGAQPWRAWGRDFHLRIRRRSGWVVLFVIGMILIGLSLYFAIRPPEKKTVVLSAEDGTMIEVPVEVRRAPFVPPLYQPKDVGNLADKWADLDAVARRESLAKALLALSDDSLITFQPSGVVKFHTKIWRDLSEQEKSELLVRIQRPGLGLSVEF